MESTRALGHHNTRGEAVTEGGKGQDGVLSLVMREERF